MTHIENVMLRISGTIEEQNGRVAKNTGDTLKAKWMEEEGKAKKKIAETRLHLEEVFAEIERKRRALRRHLS
jgi:hypothetical protein